MVLWNFLNFTILGNAHYIWHWMVLCVVLPICGCKRENIINSDKIIWSREIKVFVL